MVKAFKTVTAATCYPKDPENSGAILLRDGSSVFNAELEGILLALEKCSTFTNINKEVIIYTDRLPAVENPARKKNYRSKKYQAFLQPPKKLPPQIKIILARISSHVGIIRNEETDRLAKAALSSSVAPLSRICVSDLQSKANMYIDTIWQELWNSENRNKLYEKLRILKESVRNGTRKFHRKQESVMIGLRTGHTWITHSYLLEKGRPIFLSCLSQPLHCEACLNRMLRFYSYQKKVLYSN